ncbi:hypothetical protein [Actinomadura fibrosa]|uniref:Uncharacterized protein n=1 Tax=Actinomadura fibrosa TaxID=111802 RepID=A0ABW2XRQ8_9ACTN|nr:hypothetical protein [Actinomadura fibrosa]
MTITWRNGTALPMARPRYFDYQFLRAADLAQGLDYLLSRQNLLTRTQSPSGVLSGLAVNPAGGDVVVTAGVAVDADGMPIVLPNDTRLTLPGDGTHILTITLLERETDVNGDGGVARATRLTEEGLLKFAASAPSDPGRSLVLASVTRQGGTVTVDTASRAAAGLRVLSGAITPTAGNTRRSGIQWPSDPGGGSGDEAFLRYYVRGGEETTLLIGVSNDAGDTIDFLQGGAERLRIAGGMLHLGSINGTAVTSGQVVSALGFWGHGVQHGQLSFRAGRGFELIDASSNWPTLDYAFGSRPYADLHTREVTAAAIAGRGGALTVRGGTTFENAVVARGDLTVQANLLAQDVYHAPGKSILGQGRLHIAGEERLYLLNKGGVHINADWGGGSPGAGTLTVGSHTKPSWSGGGISTFDLFADGAIYVGSYERDNWPIKLMADGTLWAGAKHFLIDHPVEPAERDLVHAAVEGPEYAVYYRGEGRLADGRATVELPGYFEALTRPDGRTVQLTPKFEADEPLSPLAASAVADGRFAVRTVDGAPADHGFYWEVKAVRADLDELAAEVPKATH